MESRNPAPNSDLKTLLKGKVELVREFVAVTRGLHQSLRAGNAAQSAEWVKERQNLIHWIDDVDRKLKEIGAGPGGARDNPPERGSNALSPLRKDLRELLREAAHWDGKCLEEAALLMDKTRDELTALRRGYRATRHYVQTKRQEIRSRFMDVRE